MAFKKKTPTQDLPTGIQKTGVTTEANLLLEFLPGHLPKRGASRAKHFPCAYFALERNKLKPVSKILLMGRLDIRSSYQNTADGFLGP